MANTIKPKRSNTASKVPNTTELVSGELGVNMADKKIYINNGTSVVQVGAGVLSALGDVTITSPTTGQGLSWNGTAWVNASGAGSGDVTGAASSTDNALVRFDGTTGKIIQNSVVTLDDTGNESGLLSEQYNTSTTPPAIVAGLEAWDSGNGTLEVGLAGGNVSYKYGQQEFVRAYNGSASTMTKGQVVYIVGAQGNRVDVRLAQANAESTSANTIGMVVESIAAGAEGWVQVSGSLYKIDTSTLTAGQAIYLSPSVLGGYTTTKPTAPNHIVILGFVQRISATVGSFYLKVDNGYELDELHNVLITSPASGNTLIYDAVAGVWENANLTAGTGISVTNGAGSITVANSGVLGVTATSPVASSGGQNPVISMPAATTSVSGYLTSTDWNTFNGKYSVGGALGTPSSGTLTNCTFPTLNQNTTGSSGSCTGNSATATTATTANALNTANSYTGVNFTATGSLIVGSNGTYAAGSIYSDVNWGMIFRAKQASPTGNAQFMWADSAGNELFRYNGSLTTSVTGSSGSCTGNAASASTAYKFDSTVRCYSYEWIEMPNYSGLYSPLNSAHFYPNNGSYGSWRVDGSRNGWQGIEFQGQTTLMMNDDSYGFHRNTGGGWRFYNTGGNGYFPGVVQAYWSDRRLKENLIPIRNESLDILSKLTTYRFNWNSKVKELDLPIEVGKEEIGLIAQEVQAILPDAVAINKSLNKVNEDGTQQEHDYLTINYDKITPLLVEGVNLLKKEIEELKIEIAKLKGQK